MAFLLDTNVFIKAKNEYLAFDIAPDFWAWLEQEAEAQQVMSVDAVWNELEPQDDELAEWVRPRRSLFRPIDATVVAAIQRVNSWAQAEANTPLQPSATSQQTPTQLSLHTHSPVDTRSSLMRLRDRSNRLGSRFRPRLPILESSASTHT